MKHSFYKSAAIFLTLAILAAIGSGCSTVTAKPEPAQTAVPPGAAAETPAEKACSLYAELLKAHPAILQEDTAVLDDLSFGYEENLARFGEHYDYFAVTDLDQDGIPELAAYTVINNGWVPVSVFRYNAFENAVQLLKDPLAPESHATFEHMSTAGGAYSLYICKENHLHSCWGGDTPVGFREENHAYILKDGSLAAVDCSVSSHRGNAADIAADFRDILRVNDEEARNSVFGS